MMNFELCKKLSLRDRRGVAFGAGLYLERAYRMSADLRCICFCEKRKNVWAEKSSTSHPKSQWHCDAGQSAILPRCMHFPCGEMLNIIFAEFL